MKDFNGKVVVVTGAGSGIGKETALAFARRGARLVICDVDGEGLRGTTSELEALGCEVYSEIADVSKAWQVEEFRDNAYRVMGTVDVLVNNAGVAVGGKVEHMSLDDWEWIAGVNIWGVIHGCHYFYPGMIARGRGGHIVNVASGVVIAPIPLTSAYACTKGAVFALSETMRAEAALHGIGVSVICPGVVSTDLARSARVVSGTGRSSGEKLKDKSRSLWERRKYPPEKVAARILKAVEKNTGVAVDGPETYFFDFVHRFSRGLYDWGLRRLTRFIDRLA